MSRRSTRNQHGIRINDWFAQICLGIFFFCIGSIFITLFLSADPKAIASLTIEDWVGVVLLVLIPTVFMDVGLLLAIGGWKKRHTASTINPGSILNSSSPPGVSADGGSLTEEQQKAMQAISGGISIFYTLSIWVQRIVGVVAAFLAICIAAFFWITAILDSSGKASLNPILMLDLGVVLISYVVIVYFMLLRKPRADQNAP